MGQKNAVELLQAVCDEACLKHTSSCSHAVWAVIRGIAIPDAPYRVANELIKHMSKDWLPKTLPESLELANKGVIVVGGLAGDGDASGHVIVVYPGEMKMNGGYEYDNKKLKKKMILKGTKKYPLCMSTSSGSWPGAKSNGDKTVWDPWGKDDTFAKVQFWTPKPAN